MLKFCKVPQDFDENIDNINADAKLETIPLEMIRPNPYQPRKMFNQEALEELAASLKQYGLLQPISVRKMGAGRYELIAGERRFRAAHLAGFTTIRAIVFSAVEQDSAMIAMIENLQRENLHFFEEAEGYLNLLRDHGFTQEELAVKLGKNQSTIANKLRILKLSTKVKDRIFKEHLTERHARALLRLHDEQEQLKLIQIICEQSLSVKKSEDLVEKTLQRMYGELPRRNKNSQNVFYIMKDYKVYLNTIKKIIKKMQETGADISYDTEDMSKKLRINITIAK
ncbi:MAG: ParB/RepB/Spo0J family partition protein [Eubacteriales bacterium]